ncbi:MAG: exo-beta-N-acetylmuramidase NamZ family protein [Bacteroidales bacterium]
MKYFFILFLSFSLLIVKSQNVITGAEQTERYLPLLSNKSVGVVCNHSALIQQTHLVDSLLKSGIRVVKIFAPEHGFRGDYAPGEWVATVVDSLTQLPIVSLYGKKKKPSSADLKEIDILIFDIQDVGVRFYTYISTLHYVMEAAAENHIPLIILDRPNPLGFYVDGPVLDTVYRSFVGMHPVPVVHGMTVGEYAQMINGEHWLKNGVQCKLTVIPCKNYNHNLRYELKIKPSPNLVNMQSVYLYPSLCLFEGTPISVGRGTPYPFQVIGHPFFKGKYAFSFEVPVKLGKKHLLKTKTYYGLDLRTATDSTFTLKYLIEFYRNYPQKNEFFNSFFIKLIGNKKVYEAIKAGKSDEEIRKLWKEDLEAFKLVRKKYLLYD